jgi:hypothetical protein
VGVGTGVGVGAAGTGVGVGVGAAQDCPANKTPDICSLTIVWSEYHPLAAMLVKSWSVYTVVALAKLAASK